MRFQVVLSRFSFSPFPFFPPTPSFPQQPSPPPHHHSILQNIYHWKNMRVTFCFVRFCILYSKCFLFLMSSLTSEVDSIPTLSNSSTYISVLGSTNVLSSNLRQTSTLISTKHRRKGKYNIKSYNSNSKSYNYNSNSKNYFDQ